VLPRVIKLPPKLAGCDYGFVFLSSIIHAHVGRLFSEWKYTATTSSASPNSDLFVDEESKEPAHGTAEIAATPLRRRRATRSGRVPAGNDKPPCVIRTERR
jgi:polyphosphate kinase